MPLRLQLQGIKLDFFILLLKFALIKFHRYIIMELDKSKIGKLKLISNPNYNLITIQRLYGNSYATTHIHAERANRKVEFSCCYLRTLGKDFVLFNTSIKVTVQLNEECREIYRNAKLINR